MLVCPGWCGSTYVNPDTEANMRALELHVLHCAKAKATMELLSQYTHWLMVEDVIERSTAPDRLVKELLSGFVRATPQTDPTVMYPPGVDSAARDVRMSPWEVEFRAAMCDHIAEKQRYRLGYRRSDLTPETLTDVRVTWDSGEVNDPTYESENHAPEFVVEVWFGNERFLADTGWVIEAMTKLALGMRL